MTYQELERLRIRSQYLEVIHAFSVHLAECQSVDDVVWAVTKYAVARLGFVDCVVYLFDEDETFLIQRAAYGPKNPIDFDINDPIILEKGQGICGYVALTGKAEIISDTSIDARYEIDDERRLSEIAVPILADGKVLGVIDSEHPDLGFYTLQHLDILKTIAAMASSKIVEANIQARLKNYHKELEQLVTARTLELRQAIDQLQESNELLVSSNQQNETLLSEIKASISYAKGIQNAILPSRRLIQEHLSDSFILYKPKDIIAGDFYWMEVVANVHDNEILFAVADCTGHGVPGAIISVVCNNALNRAVREYALRDPGAVLNRTRKIVNEEFAKSEVVVSDGMDIALCHLRGRSLKYAGANNPLLLIRNGVITEIKANKQPIGRFEKAEPFHTHELELLPGDSVYLFSDGYPDQFGGPDGKKFNLAAFRDVLVSIQDKSMGEQAGILEDRFESWKGDLTQVDDVCVLGFRIS